MKPFEISKNSLLYKAAEWGGWKPYKENLNICTFTQKLIKGVITLTGLSAFTIARSLAR